MQYIWRAEVDALAFTPQSHEGNCFVHRLAFRALGAEPARAACEAFFLRHAMAFDLAARTKIDAMPVVKQANFHLTSRDIRRAMAQIAVPVEGRAPIGKVSEEQTATACPENQANNMQE